MKTVSPIIAARAPLKKVMANGYVPEVKANGEGYGLERITGILWSKNGHHNVFIPGRMSLVESAKHVLASKTFGLA